MWAVLSHATTWSFPMMSDISKTSCVAERFLEIVPSVPTTKGMTWVIAWYISLTYHTIPLHFCLVCLHGILIQRYMTSFRMYSWRVLCTNVILGWLLSKCLLDKIAAFHMSFTCSSLTTDCGECLYLFSMQWDQTSYIVLNIFFGILCRCVYTLFVPAEFGHRQCVDTFSRFPTQPTQGKNH